MASERCSAVDRVFIGGRWVERQCRKSKDLIVLTYAGMTETWSGQIAKLVKVTLCERHRERVPDAR